MQGRLLVGCLRWRRERRSCGGGAHRGSKYRGVDCSAWWLTNLSGSSSTSPNGCLLQGLERALHSQRQTLAEVVAHLGELEERRLHLEAAHGSLFSYCVRRLGMSEDESYRRIELARLARRFPALFPELASGAIGLSVALLLKPVLSDDNQRELLAAARGASLARARELVAACAPRPDAASTIRKLPGPRSAPSAREAAAVPGTLESLQPAPSVPGTLVSLPSTREPAAQPLPTVPGTVASLPSAREPAAAAQPLSPGAPSTSTPPAATSPPARALQRIEPLSPQRYRVQFTADAELKPRAGGPTRRLTARKSALALPRSQSVGCRACLRPRAHRASHPDAPQLPGKLARRRGPCARMTRATSLGILPLDVRGTRAGPQREDSATSSLECEGPELAPIRRTRASSCWLSCEQRLRASRSAAGAVRLRYRPPTPSAARSRPGALKRGLEI